jgi:hypothetical protein
MQYRKKAEKKVKRILKSESNSSGTKTSHVKPAAGKQQTSTTKAGEERTSSRSILSWLAADPVTTESTQIPRGRGKKDT